MSEQHLSIHRGLSIDSSDGAGFRAALRGVVDYRGDVSIRLSSSEASVTGYVYDCVAPDTDDAALRLLPSDGSASVSVPLRDVERIEITGRDTAAGRSFETWLKKYVEKKLAGESPVWEDVPDPG